MKARQSRAFRSISNDTQSGPYYTPWRSRSNLVTRPLSPATQAAKSPRKASEQRGRRVYKLDDGFNFIRARGARATAFPARIASSSPGEAGACSRQERRWSRAAHFERATIYGFRAGQSGSGNSPAGHALPFLSPVAAAAEEEKGASPLPGNGVPLS